jgi:hypothetical protein
MLTVYLDESGHEGKDLMVLAGFLGDAVQWRICEENWKLALGKRSHLHMNDLRWSKPERIERLLSALGSVPHAAGLQAVVATASMSDYDDLVSGSELERLYKSYMISLIGIINVVTENIPAYETFKLVLERNDRYEVNVQSLFRGSKKSNGGGKLISIEFVDKGVTALTEPGDYLAYAMLERHRNAGSVRDKLCSPIFNNTRPALARFHHLQPELVRDLVNNTIAKFPHLKGRPVSNGI